MELKIGVWKNKSAQHSTADIYPVWKGCMYIVIPEMLWPKQWWLIMFEHPIGSHFKVSHGKHPASGYALIAKSFPSGSDGKDDNEDQNSNKAIYFFEWLVFLLAVLKLGVRSTALHYWALCKQITTIAFLVYSPLKNVMIDFIFGTVQG